MGCAISSRQHFAAAINFPKKLMRATNDCRHSRESAMDAKCLPWMRPVTQTRAAERAYLGDADQTELDHYWNALSEGGTQQQCGWLKDRFGLSWQVVPRRLGELLSQPDRAAAERAMKAIMEMTKLDVAALEAAARG